LEEARAKQQHLVYYTDVSSGGELGRGGKKRSSSRRRLSFVADDEDSDGEPVKDNNKTFTLGLVGSPVVPKLNTTEVFFIVYL
jgi:hypothetical protein